MYIQELVDFLNTNIPLDIQEEYDNSGLLVGDTRQELKGVLISVDATEEVIDEAIRKEANFVLTHHPVIFSGLRNITGKNYVERTVIKAIRNNIVIYAAHTSLDNLKDGINFKMADKLGLKNQTILKPAKNQLLKLVFFVPHDHADAVRKAVFDAGAGIVGDYEGCSYNLDGKGSFRPGEGTDPYVGQMGQMHFEEETRVETWLPRHKTGQVLKAMNEAHPYEEVAYDLYPLLNSDRETGAGVIGELDEEIPEKEFLDQLKQTFNLPAIRHTKLLYSFVSRIALCGGSGSFLLEDAIAQGADAFVSADFKYHRFFDAEDKILIADIGHYESEAVAKDFFYELLREKFHNFAVHLSEINTNPINYF